MSATKISINSIPQGWIETRLKDVATCNDEALSDSVSPEKEIRYVEISDVSEEEGITNVSSMVFDEAPSRARRITRKGDVVISTVRTYLRAVALVEEDDLIVSTGFAVLRPKSNVLSRYLHYLLLEDSLLSEVIKESTGVSYPAIQTGSLVSLPIILPPLDEQARIAAYLDEKIAAINATIAVRNEELKLLKKFKQSKIAEVVTHGLTPNVTTKSSPLGQIPAHWEVLRLKNFATTIKGKAADYYDEPIDGAELVLSVEVLRGAASPALNYAVCSDPEQHCTANDIVVIWDGAGVGEFLRAKEGLIASTTAKFVLDKKKIYSNFFWYFGGRVEEIQKNMPTGMGIPHVSPNILNNTEFAIPPFEEQVEISKYLDVECEKIDRKCKLIDEQIKKMQLLKRALINEVVTGKRQLA